MQGSNQPLTRSIWKILTNLFIFSNLRFENSGVVGQNLAQNENQIDVGQEEEVNEVTGVLQMVLELRLG